MKQAQIGLFLGRFGKKEYLCNRNVQTYHYEKDSVDGSSRHDGYSKCKRTE